MASFIQAVTLGLAFLTAVIEAAPSTHAARWGSAQTSKAVYFISNGQQNAVFALPIGHDGTLSKGSSTGTGGSGSHHADVTTGSTAGGDALLSQSSLVVAGDWVFAVNAGSDSLSMFSISEWDPTKLTLIGKPAAIPGDFPNSVSVSLKNRLACVVTSGVRAGVSCANFSPAGLGKMDALRPFALNQVNPPTGPPGTTSQILFSPDETKVYALVKGSPGTLNPGFVSVFDVACKEGYYGTLSAKGTRSSPSGSLLLFGAQLVPHTNNVFAADPSLGAVLFSVDQKTNEATTVALAKIAAQKAACWIAISSKTESAFVGDAGRSAIVELSLSDASIITTHDVAAAGDKSPGFLDLKVGRSFLYAISPGNATVGPEIAVLDLSQGRGKAQLVQSYSLGGLGLTASVQGMAIF